MDSSRRYHVFQSIRFGVDDQNFGQGSGYVMSQMVDARFDVHRWSAYSQIAILSNIRYGRLNWLYLHWIAPYIMIL